MVKVYIDMTGDATSWLWSREEFWKDYVAVEFDSKVVLHGNRDYAVLEEAEWYKCAREVIEDYESQEYLDSNWYVYNWTKEQLDKVIAIYDACEYPWADDVTAQVAMTLFPELKLETAVIRGNSQSEWQKVIYVKDSINLNILQAFYFGDVCSIYAIDEYDIDLGSVIIPTDDFWNMEKNDIEEGLKELLELDEVDQIYKCTGYKQVPDWQEIAV